MSARRRASPARAKRLNLHPSRPGNFHAVFHCAYRALIGLAALIAGGAPARAASGPVDVFLIAGQSNALGEGDSTQSPAVAPNTVFQYFDNVLSAGSDPVGGAHTGSAWPAFGDAYYATNNRRIVLVPFAFANTAQLAAADIGNGNWQPGSTLLPTR